MTRVLPASVIVPSRDRPEFLRSCIGSVLAGAAVPAEIVVIDQSRTRNEQIAKLGIVHGSRILYHHTAVMGVSAARNTAAAIATQPVLAFIDDDILVTHDWLEVMVSEAQDAGGAPDLISGRVLATGSIVAGDFAPSLIDDETARTYSGRTWNDVLYSGNMAFDRSVFDALGEFDVRLGPGGRFRSAEDNDYGFRALDAGYRIRYASQGVVLHQAWRRPSDELPLAWTYGLGQGAFLAKHVQIRDRDTFHRLRAAVGRHLRRAARKRRDHPAAARADAVHALALICGAVGWLVTERTRGR